MNNWIRRNEKESASVIQFPPIIVIVQYYRAFKYMSLYLREAEFVIKKMK